jgi:serine/threonine protein kinase
VPYECVKLNKKLGEGQFGQVWEGVILSRKGSRTVAIKMLHGTNFLFVFCFILFLLL